MTDREMLEMAARAAGIELEWNDKGESGYWEDWRGLPNWEPWNPLTDDGDALRLGVKVGIGIFPPKVPTQAGDFAVASLDADIGQDTWFQESVVKANPYAATRRAITRAAAEIGRQMEERSSRHDA